MSRTIGATLPREVLDAFDGSLTAERVGLGYLLVTIDADGRPRPAMLSAGEILATGDQALRLATWARSTSADNLASRRPCFLTYVGPGTVLHVHGTPAALSSGDGLACFEMRVERVDADAHPGMPTIQTITYACEAMSPDDVLDEWRRSLGALRRAPTPTVVDPEGAS